MKSNYTNMFSILLILVGLQIHGNSASLHAQDGEKKSAELPTANELIKRHIKSIGGEQALRKLHSIKLTGTLKNDVAGHKFDAELSTLAVAPDKYRLVLQHPSFSLIRVANGEKAWGWRSAQNIDEEGTTEWLPEEEARSFIERAIFNPELNREKLFKSLETVGLTSVGDRKAYKVQATTHDNQTHSRFFDIKSGRLVKIERMIKSAGLGDYKRETLVTNYQQHEGVWIPMRLAHTLHTGEFPGTQVHEFSKATINQEINEKLFQVPSKLGSPKKQTKPHSHDKDAGAKHKHSDGSHKHPATEKKHSHSKSKNDKY